MNRGGKGGRKEGGREALWCGGILTGREKGTGHGGGVQYRRRRHARLATPDSTHKV